MTKVQSVQCKNLRWVLGTVHQKSTRNMNALRCNSKTFFWHKSTLCSQCINMPPKTSEKAAKKSGKAQKAVTKGDKKGRRGGRSPMPSTSTRSWSRCTPAPASPPRSWASWTPSSPTSSRGSPPRPPALLTTTRGPPSPPWRSRPLRGSCYPVSWPITPCRRAPRLSPRTSAPSKLCPDVIHPWVLVTAIHSRIHPRL